MRNQFFLDRIFCICPLTPTCNFLKSVRRPCAARLSPHLPVFEVTWPSAWLANCRGSRRRSAPNAPKKESSKEEFTKERSVYSSQDRKEQTVVDLHLIAAAGRADVLPSNAKGVAPDAALVGGWVGNEDRLVFQFLSAAIPVAGMQPIFHDSKWDGIKDSKKVSHPDLSSTRDRQWIVPS